MKLSNDLREIVKVELSVDRDQRIINKNNVNNVNQLKSVKVQQSDIYNKVEVRKQKNVLKPLDVSKLSGSSGASFKNQF